MIIMHSLTYSVLKWLLGDALLLITNAKIAQIHSQTIGDVSEGVSEDYDDDDGCGDPSSSGLPQIAATKVPEAVSEVQCFMSESPHAGYHSHTW